MRSIAPPVSFIERFIFPASSSKTRKPIILSAQYRISPGASPASALTNTTNPAPILPATIPPAETRARLTL
jgi:hypothetical protein